MNFRKSLVGVFTVLCLTTGVLVGQTFRGGISGTVADASGAAVAGAAVKLVSPDTGLTREEVTTSTGEFVFPDLPLGKYDVTVTQAGFDTVHVTGVVVDAGKISNVGLKLDVAKQATTIEVAAATVAIETSSSAETSIITTQQLLDVPLNGRDFTQLLKYNPGATANGSLNGARVNGGIDWKIDGADNNDLWHNTNAVNQGGVSGIAGTLLPIDAIAEFSLQSSSSAEEGRNSGGALNVVIKSGTNSLHGSAYYFNRNEFLAAASWFTPPGSPTTELRNSQWGGSLGGPIVKNHTFFFFNYEQQNYRQALAAVGTTPSAAWVSAASAQMAADGVAVNPLMLRTISYLWPANSLTGPGTFNNYNGGGQNLSNSYNGVIKIDHQFNERNNLAFRYFGGTGNQVESVSGSSIPYYFQIAPSRMHNFSLVYNAVISPRFVAQTLVGVNYFKQVFDDNNHGFNMPSIGFNTGVTDPADFGAPNIIISGFDQTGLTPPLGRIDTTGHIDQTFTYTTGSHEIRFGGEYRYARLDVFYDAGAPGAFTFDGTQGPLGTPDNTTNTWGFPTSQNQASLNALADFLSGRVAFGHANITYGNQQRIYNLPGGSFFGQDSWKVTSKLTLNFGLNWMYQSPITNPKDLISTFIPADGGITYVGTHGLGNTLWPRDLHDFAPRVGFAYQPHAGGRLVIRGGWGMFYVAPNVSFFGNSGVNGAASGINDNIGGPAPVLALSNPTPITLESGVPIFSTNSATGPFGGFSVSRHFVDGYSLNTHLNIQYQLAKDVVGEVGYSGSLGRHLADMLDINQIPIGSPNELNSSRPYYSQFPNLGPIDEIQSVGNSNYNSLIGSLRTSNFHGFTSKLAYTYGHSLDDLSYARHDIPQNSYCLECEYGNSDFDIRQSFSTFLSYTPPEPGSHRLFLGGWQFIGNFSFFTGTPFTVLSGNDSSGTAEFNDRAEVVGNPFANVPASDRATGTYYYFNPAAFALPAQGTYSNQGRNEFYGPGTKQIDFSVFKNFGITERVKAQFRVEIYNLFNFVNYATGGNEGGGQGYVANNVSGSNLGTIPTTYDVGYGAPGIGPGAPRNVQLALKILW